jgi:hypothetical protein
MLETPLQQARRHVVEAEPRVLRQKALLDELRAHGHDTRKAQLLLSSMENILRLMREHLAFEEKRSARWIPRRQQSFRDVPNGP